MRLKPKSKKVKVPKVTEAKKERRWSVMKTAINTNEEAKATPALFHDPALFYRDQDKDRSKDAIREEHKDGMKKVIEKNPL